MIPSTPVATFGQEHFGQAYLGDDRRTRSVAEGADSPPAGYGFRLDDSYLDSARTYQSKPIPVKTANAAIAEVLDYYISGLAPEWMVVERTEDLGFRDTLNVHAKFRQGDMSNGIGIQVYANVAPVGRSAPVILMIQALNCGEDIPGLPSGEVCWQGPV